jgi:hemerythrin-like domain-containing protein
MISIVTKSSWITTYTEVIPFNDVTNFTDFLESFLDQIFRFTRHIAQSWPNLSKDKAKGSLSSYLYQYKKSYECENNLKFELNQSKKMKNIKKIERNMRNFKASRSLKEIKPQFQ